MYHRLKIGWRDLDPWLYMLLALGVVGLVGLIRYGLAGLPQLIAGPAVAGISDLLINGLAKKRWFYPLSATITGLICALVLPIGALFYVGAAALIAILLKHVLQVNERHIFNPAGLGIVLVARWSGLQLSWWGEAVILVTIIAGFLNCLKANRLPQALMALVSYVITLLIVRMASVAIRLVDVWLTVSHLPWFFMLFVVPEPKSSVRPIIYQLVFGLVVGVGSVFYSFTPFKDYPQFYALFTANLLAVFIRTHESEALTGRKVKISQI